MLTPKAGYTTEGVMYDAFDDFTVAGVVPSVSLGGGKVSLNYTFPETGAAPDGTGSSSGDDF